MIHAASPGHGIARRILGERSMVQWTIRCFVTQGIIFSTGGADTNYRLRNVTEIKNKVPFVRCALPENNERKENDVWTGRGKKKYWRKNEQRRESIVHDVRVHSICSDSHSTTNCTTRRAKRCPNVRSLLMWDPSLSSLWNRRTWSQCFLSFASVYQLFRLHVATLENRRTPPGNRR